MNSTKNWVFGGIGIAVFAFLFVTIRLQSNRISQAQAAYEQFTTTSISLQSCSTLSPKEYVRQKQQLCCTAQMTECQPKLDCKSQKAQQLLRQVSQRESNLKFLIGAAVVWLIVIVRVFYHKMTEQRREREELNLLILFYVKRLRVLEEEKKKRIRQLLQKSFVAEEYSEDPCSICLEDFMEQRVIKLRCSHLFHSECIVNWMEIKNSCPFCRAEQ